MLKMIIILYNRFINYCCGLEILFYVFSYVEENNKLAQLNKTQKIDKERVLLDGRQTLILFSADAQYWSSDFSIHVMFSLFNPR